MAQCPKCGSEVSEEMGFCPKCGAALKMQSPPPAETRPRHHRRNEKSEKDEKHEKDEKGEKGEKGEKQGYGFLGPLIGGLILIFLGASFWLELTGVLSTRYMWSFFLLLVGIVIIIAALYAAFVLTKRHPRP
jgi:hypothetical protein